MDPVRQWVQSETRRQFFSRGANAVGWAALASLAGQLDRTAGAADATKAAERPNLAHFAPKAKHVIYLHMVGGPSQIDSTTTSRR